MKLCKDCKYYRPGEREVDDVCVHEKAYRGGVREAIYFLCKSMLSGICEQNRLFEPREASPDEREAA